MAGEEDEITSMPPVEPLEIESSHAGDSRKIKIRRKVIKVLRWLSAVAGSLAVGGGLGVGCVLKLSEISFGEEWNVLLSVPGEVLLRMLNVLTLPLVVAVVIAASCQLEQSAVTAKFVCLLLLLYLSSSLMGSALGSVAVLVVQPTAWTTQPDTGEYVQGKTHWLYLILDFLRNTVPDNLMEAYFKHIKTVVNQPNSSEDPEGLLILDISWNDTEVDPANDSSFLDPSQEHSKNWEQVSQPGLALLGVVVTHSVLGLACSSLKGELPTMIYTFFHSFQAVITKMADLVLWYFPIGVFFLCVCDVLKGVVFPFSQEMILFMAVLLSAMLVHGLLLVLFVYWLLVRKNPLIFLKAHWTPLLVAFGTGSNTASLPFALKSSRKLSGGDDHLARLLLCVGAAINLDGAAIYVSAATLLLIQMNGIPLSFEHYLYVGLVSFPLSVVSQSLEANGVVYMHQLLITQMSTQQMDQLMAAEYIVGRTRAAINLLSDVVAAAVMQHFFARPPAQGASKAAAMARRLRRSNSARNAESRRLLVSQNLEQSGIHAAYANDSSAQHEGTEIL